MLHCVLLESLPNTRTQDESDVGYNLPLLGTGKIKITQPSPHSIQIGVSEVLAPNRSCAAARLAPFNNAMRARCNY